MILLGGALPVLGPVIGGFVSGLIAKGGLWDGAKAGFTAGIFGALVVIIIGLVIGTLTLGLFLVFAGTWYWIYPYCNRTLLCSSRTCGRRYWRADQ